MKNMRIFIITAIMMCVIGMISVNAEENEPVTEVSETTAVTEVTETSTEESTETTVSMPEETESASESQTTSTEISTDVTETTAVTTTVTTTVTTENIFKYEFSYKIVNNQKVIDHIEITGMLKAVSDIEIPAEIEGYPVTVIRNYAFENCAYLKNVTIPQSVTFIGDYAFSGCKNLKNIVLPENLKTIGYGAFKGSGIESIVIPDSITEIDDFALCNCSNLTSITFSANMMKIPYGAFDGCTGLKEITIPEQIVIIDEWAFNNCSGLKSVTIENSECNIVNSTSICNSYTTQANYSGIIYGHDNSTAQDFAKENGYKFVSSDMEKLKGDANYDGILNVRDAACIAQKLAQHRESDLPDWSDYNEDGTINVRDAAAIAAYLVKQSSADVNDKIQNGDIDNKTWKAPKKEDYNLKAFDGLKKYVNDYIEYYAYVEYKITNITYDDTVDPWSGGNWNAPAVYVPNTDSYMEQNDGLLEIGSYLYKLPQDYSKDGWESYFFIAKDESEMADLLAHDSKTALDMMASELKVYYKHYIEDGMIDESVTFNDMLAVMELTITWRSLGDGNYELYTIW